MTYLFHLGHPAHFHLFRHIIKKLKNNNIQIIITIKEKDVLLDLLNSENWEYYNILPESNNQSNNLLFNFLYKLKMLNKIIKKYNPKLLIGTSAEIGIIGQLNSLKSIIVNEDDWNQVLLFSLISYPFAYKIIAPESCSVGPWNYKKISYKGYHELTYLSPKYFIPNKNKILSLYNDRERYFIIRLAKLTAHHDYGKIGLNNHIVKKIISILEPHGQIHISSERKLDKFLERYKIKLVPSDIHHALYYSDLYIGDSQTMAAESAVLGTPSIRFNDFVGKLGYLEELEHKYRLTFGIKTKDEELLFKKITELVNNLDNKMIIEDRKIKMLEEQIDVNDFFYKYLKSLFS